MENAGQSPFLAQGAKEIRRTVGTANEIVTGIGAGIYNRVIDTVGGYLSHEVSRFLQRLRLNKARRQSRRSWGKPLHI